ncbi:MAG: beta-propeller domain-containing protein [Acidimicrobiia bacterium]
MRHRARISSLAIGLALTTGACAPGALVENTLSARPLIDQQPVRSVALAGFDACAEFLDYVKSHALDLVGPYGLEGYQMPPWSARLGAIVEEDMAMTTMAGSAAADPTFSGTNVQVNGVDEPDLAKTDGSRIVVVSEGYLIVVDVSGPEPVETGRLLLGDASYQSLFLSGDRALLFGSSWNPGPVPLGVESDVARFAPVSGSPTLEIVEVELGGEPRVVHTMSIDGSFISGRMIDGVVRLVSTSGPVGFEWSYPSGTGLRAERKAIEENKEIVRKSTKDNWIPYYVVADGDGNVVDEGTLFDCDRAAHPDEFSGLNMLSILTIDLSNGLDVADATGVLANGETVYASEDSLYVATQNWQVWRFLGGMVSDEPDGPETEIHKFDISDPRMTSYSASGSVSGYLLNQFALDENDGYLRVASTTTPTGWGSSPDSNSRVTILDQFGERLLSVGMVDGLGETEQIYSVRFVGDVGYVVTFRQTDPLYVIDLSDPRAPEMVGELKIPGYSAYLHPLGDGLLMGVGQDATEGGRVEGTQVSIFDVSDPSNPRRLDTFTLDSGSNSEIEYDHHAFLYWDGLAVIPVQQYWWDEKSDSVFMGAIALRVSEDGDLVKAGEIVHPGGDDENWDGRAQIRRSLVVGDSVYTVSSKGLMKNDLDTLDEEGWLDF